MTIVASPVDLYCTGAADVPPKSVNVPMCRRLSLLLPTFLNTIPEPLLLLLFLLMLLVGNAVGQTAQPSVPPGPGRSTIPPAPTAPASANKAENGTRVFLRLGTPCQNDTECPIVNAVCINQTCACKMGFTTQTNASADASCISPHQPAGPPSSGSGGAGGGSGKKHNYQPSQSENMIPMIVCLAIMFVGMCVALQLFSRARFRNQRSVFNSPNPRLLHLMKADRHDSKKRRHSHVGTASRRPSCASNISIPRGSRPGSRIGSRASSPDLRKQAALNSIAVIDMQAAATEDIKANVTELASLVDNSKAKIDAERVDA